MAGQSRAEQETQQPGKPIETHKAQHEHKHSSTEQSIAEH
jgi:hypothetical protein